MTALGLGPPSRPTSIARLLTPPASGRNCCTGQYHDLENYCRPCRVADEGVT